MSNPRNIVKYKSNQFSIRIVKLYLFLCSEKKKVLLSKKKIPSKKSIGADNEKAVEVLSKKYFIAKCSISYKGERVRNYWLRLLLDGEHLNLNVQNI